MNKYLSSTYQAKEGLKPEWSADSLGGKGFGLMRMTAAGVNVPPAIVIGTEACRDYMKDPEEVMAVVVKEIVPFIVATFKKDFGYMPLVSVRSGAKFSMPGMMDTILNVGLDSESFKEWEARVGKDCAFNSYERLIEMFGNVVNGVERAKFAEAHGTAAMLGVYKKETGSDFPDAEEQLINAIEAVFKSWNNERAKSYRRMNKIADDLGTAVTVQAMVFGNMGKKSCTGVLFTRNPSDGSPAVVGEFLVNAQGEDVVAGIRTPEPLVKLSQWNEAAATELLHTVDKLEKAGRDMQDVEFTVQEGKLFILQTRNAKRTAQAAVRIAVDMLNEGLISEEEAVARVTFKQFLAAVRPSILPSFRVENEPNLKGIPASNGCAVGVAVFSSEAAKASKVPCILIAKETTPDDIEGMNAAVGILTETGGATSHAAVVARGMDKVCVVGCTDLVVSEDSAILDVSDEEEIEIKAGDFVTMDGSTGEVWLGKQAPIVGGGSNQYIRDFMTLIESRYPVYRTCAVAEDFDGSKNVMVASYLADRDAMTSEQVTANMMDLLALAKDCEAVVIDLRPFSELVREADAPVEFLFSKGMPSNTVYHAKVQALLKAREMWSGFEDKTRILGFMPLLFRDMLVNKGFGIIPVVETLDRLLDVNGLCIPDLAALTKLVSKENVLRIVQMKKKLGEDVRSFNIVEAFTPEEMKRGAVMALSRMQMVQSVLA